MLGPYEHAYGDRCFARAFPTPHPCSNDRTTPTEKGGFLARLASSSPELGAGRDGEEGPSTSPPRQTKTPGSWFRHSSRCVACSGSGLAAGSLDASLVGAPDPLSLPHQSDKGSTTSGRWQRELTQSGRHCDGAGQHGRSFKPPASAAGGIGFWRQPCPPHPNRPAIEITGRGVASAQTLGPPNQPTERARGWPAGWIRVPTRPCASSIGRGRGRLTESWVSAEDIFGRIRSG